MSPAAGPAAGPVPRRAPGLWEGYGVEIEMMIVDRESLDVRAVADRLFELQGWAPGAGENRRGREGREDDGDSGSGGGSTAVPGDDPTPRVEAGSDVVLEAASDLVVEGVGWSNEVALHVLELKTPGPVSGLDGIARAFQRSVNRANSVLEELGCRLLPGGMHPWMDPGREFRMWPHEYTEVYRTFDRIFGCRGHGWSNLQSTHVNLSFSDDREFELLHEAVRLVLPVVPALAASSPVVDGRVGPALDSRMVAYRGHARRVPSVTGSLVPESVRSEAEYRSRILEPLYRDLAPVDPEGVLHHEWVNARGAIARFGRGSVEIRVIDAQESPRMDLAVVAAVTAAVRRVADVLEAEGARGGGGDDGGGGGAPVAVGAGPGGPGASTEELALLMDRTVRSGRGTKLEPFSRELYRRVLDLPTAPGSVGDVWEGFLSGSPVRSQESGSPGWHGWEEPLRVILEEGNLAERILG
ncbi:MAG: glutamate-cysteine ligase family protein, partial [bacterium]